MDTLTAEQLDTLRARLEQLCELVERQLASSEQDSQPVGLDQPIGRLTRQDALLMQSMAKANRSQLKGRLQLVRRALAAFEEGDYGLCRRCQQPIAWARLDARPESPLCLPCQERAERGR